MQNKIAFIWTKNAVMANALNCMHRLENNWLYSQNKFPTINSTLKQKITSLNDNFKKNSSKHFSYCRNQMDQ